MLWENGFVLQCSVGLLTSLYVTLGEAFCLSALVCVSYDYMVAANVDLLIPV